MSVVLPAPVCPTIAIRSPGRTVKETSLRTQECGDAGTAGAAAAPPGVAGPASPFVSAVPAPAAEGGTIRGEAPPSAAEGGAPGGAAATPGPTGPALPALPAPGATPSRRTYSNQTLRNSIWPRPRAGRWSGCSGSRMDGSVSRSLKMRSEDAIAPWSMLYFSDRSWIGRKKRRAYWRNAATTPTETVPPRTPIPPYAMISASATAVSTSITGKKRA